MLFRSRPSPHLYHHRLVRSGIYLASCGLIIMSLSTMPSVSQTYVHAIRPVCGIHMLDCLWHQFAETLLGASRDTFLYNTCKSDTAHMTPSQQYMTNTTPRDAHASKPPPDCKLGLLEQTRFFECVPNDATGNCLFASLATLSE